LAALFDLVPPGIDVLDVGIGGGALGRRLASERGCRVDGATISREEADNAAAFYRHIEVADLNQVDLATLFCRERYGAIICADVLEHLLRPTRILDACRRLLAEDGVLLLSIPNVAYVGLLGELLEGEFRYRVEGLLDRTHLRFFTRRSLLRMLKEGGWKADHVETIRLDLPDSEFGVVFNCLPQPVQRYLLAMPDALAYQFIVRARPLAAVAAECLAPTVDGEADRSAPVDVPHFSSLVYLKGDDGYAEPRKLVARGLIGRDRQRIHFVIPPQERRLTGLRLDPADRPGFLHLFGLRLSAAGGQALWQWDGEPASLEREPCQQVVFRSSLFASPGAVLLLTGNDPFFELPLEADALAACTDGAVLEVELGWPMSADYVLLVDELTRRDSRLAALEANLRQIDARRKLAEEGAAALGQATERAQQLAEERDRLTGERDALIAEAHRLRARLDAQAVAHDALRSEQEALRAEHAALGTAASGLRLQVRELEESSQLLREQIAVLRTAVERQQTANDVQARRLGQLRDRLHGIESSFAFRLMSPLIRRNLVGLPKQPALPAAVHHPAESAELTASVDVIVPVYRGLEETRACLESVLASTPKTPFRLLVVNDASPEPEITAYLRDLRQRDDRVILLENPSNLGFVASVNRAMEESGDRDVVLLNSDTEVAGDWLDRLRGAAASDRRAATVTPFSNSAEICSYPRFCADNPLPEGLDTAALDRLFAAANGGRAIEIPTAVGFCMYIRRSCLAAIGLFDTERFGRGYGEENDFCMRARKAGWHHLLAMDVFVRHAGGVSFGEEKASRVRRAQELLARLYPEYHGLVHDHLAADPAQSGRLAVDVARLRASGLPGVLCVLHNTVGGGTERHVHELSQALRGLANVLALQPSQGGETILQWLAPGEVLRLGFHLPEQYEDLVATLKCLGVAHVHYHHLLGHSPSVWGLPQSLGVTHDFTAHDFYALCPQITLTTWDNRYCGEEGLEQCRECLQRSPAPGGVSIETWREGYRPLLEQARYVITPSADTATRLRRYFPRAPIVHVPHTDMAPALPAPALPAAVGERELRIVVLGALSPIKGADVLEATAIEAARRGLRLEFHLLGFAYRSLQKPPRARLTVHGQYAEPDLPDLLDWLKPDVAWFPAIWPETYSYTLSACLKAGLPIVAPDLGAFSERLNGRAWTWLCLWDQQAADWAVFFERLRTEHFSAATPPAPAAGTVASSDGFSYRRHYLDGVELPLLPLPPTDEFLKRHRPGASASVSSRPKHGLLALAVRLRRAPLLRGIARRIPLRWQTRVKVWLST
jgi:GT2 family glycosyltransferase/2-polyprenyl-3-methyl-5-hydroxy-6-metoxy-1,4-benzoquinol methylase/glycosyltransferase involved in cell wall biosynthesis